MTDDHDQTNKFYTFSQVLVLGVEYSLVEILKPQLVQTMLEGGGTSVARL